MDSHTSSRPRTSAAADAPGSAPGHGDLVVVRNAVSTPAFGVRQVPADVQFGAATRDEAIRLARAFAQSHSVDLWYSDGNQCRLLERYRNSGA